MAQTMAQNNTLIKMTPAEVADFMWNNLNTHKTIDFIVPWGEDIENNSTYYCCKMIILAGHPVIVANAYGGGELFTHEVSSTGKFTKESFQKEFAKYLTGLGNDIWVETVPSNEQQEAAPTKNTYEFTLQNFAKRLIQDVENTEPVRFWKGPAKDLVDIDYRKEIFCFRFVNTTADFTFAVCNGERGGKLFSHDVTSAESIESFETAFVKYLEDNDFPDTVQAIL